MSGPWRCGSSTGGEANGGPTAQKDRKKALLSLPSPIVFLERPGSEICNGAETPAFPPRDLITHYVAHRSAFAYRSGYPTIKAREKNMFNLQPASIVVFIFTVLLLKYVVKFIGKTSIQERAWHLYTVGASGVGHSTFATLAEKRRELVEINRQRKAISAQDEYAKWTKLNRQFDKLNADVTALAESTSSERALVNKAVSVALILSTTAPVWFARAWYRKSVLFYLPPGAFPYYVEWIVALPFIVTGGVGLTVWMYALNSVFSSIEFLVTFYSEKSVPKPEEPATKVEEVTTE